MTLFDTHCHFETQDPAVIRDVLARAAAANVVSLMAVGGSASLNAAACVAQAVAASEGALPRVRVALGFDREQIGAVPCIEPSESDALAAVGEIGLDYHYSPETRDAQCELFARQLEWAHVRDLPVVIHTREADDDTLGLLREIPSRGIIHCYTGLCEVARQLLDLGFYISISGIVTFRAADNVRAAARVVPDDRILIETDAPFLAPVPMRGKPNEPAYLTHTCAFLARERGCSTEDFAALTYANAERALARIGK